VRWSFTEADRLLAKGGCCCCGGGGPDPHFARWSLWLDEAVGFKQMVVWDKGPMGMGWHYRRSYETVLVGEKRGGKCRWYDDSQTIERFVQNRTLSQLVALIALSRLRMGSARTSNPGDSPFKILFQKCCQRQVS
jgi:hypothetical protein